MLRKLVGTLAIAPLFTSSLVLADVNQLKQWVDEGKYQQAYEHAQALLDQFEGDPEFDLQYGVAAIDTGHTSEGIFALERVLLVETENQLAKLELARAYYTLGQFAKAKRLFTEVKAVNPPASVTEKINSYLARIEDKATRNKTQITGFVELYAGYDDNINSGPDGQTTVVSLTDEALGRGDQFTQVKLGAKVNHVYADDGSLYFDFAADTRLYNDEQEQDYTNLTLAAGHRWNFKDEQYQLGASFQKYILDDNGYRDLLGINAGWNKQLSSHSLVKTFFGVNSLTYQENDWKDATQYTAGVTYLKALGGEWNPIMFTGLFAGVEEADEDTPLGNALVDRDFYGANFGLQFTPSRSLKVTPSLVYQSSEYEGFHTFPYTDQRREDDYLAFNLGAEWVVESAWTVVFNYSFVDVDSNIELYQYDRQQVMLGLRYSFQ